MPKRKTNMVGEMHAHGVVVDRFRIHPMICETCDITIPELTQDKCVS
jgi:hypothetical protein